MLRPWFDVLDRSPCMERDEMDSIDAVQKALGETGYICGRDLATVVFLSLKLGRPLFLEGEAGVGKTEIAKALSLSTRQMERLFVNETKQSMQRSYRNIRLGYGLWLLENSSRSVTDIAQECGFADTAHFSRAFKVLFDRRPSETRQLG